MHWGTSATLRARLSGGNRSDVWAAEVDGRRCTMRLSSRVPQALDWELDLVQFLGAEGIEVPEVVADTSGERRCGQFFMLSWIDGRPPAGHADWRAVARTIDRVHALTTAWRQRPTFASTVDLLTQDAGGDVDLTLMPREAVELCRGAWKPLLGMTQSAIHGDPRGNVLITRSGVALIDWDEARVDASILDLAGLPGDHAPPAELAIARRAASAWEAAAGWTLEPAYARRRLAELPGS